MHTYYVYQKIDENTFGQTIKLRDKNNQHYLEFTLPSHSKPLKLGQKIKIYKTNSNNTFRFMLAASYKINGTRQIYLVNKPITKCATQYLFDQMTTTDKIRFNFDLIEYLLQRKIMPSLSKYKNLQLYLFANQSRHIL